MSKKTQIQTVTPWQKRLGMIALIAALLYLFYHSAMSVLNKIVIYDGVWVSLMDVTFWLAIGCGALYVGYLLFFHPMKETVRTDLRKKIFTADYLLLLGITVCMFISVASAQGAFPSYDWWNINRDTLFDMLGQILILFPLGCWLARNRDAKVFQNPLRIFTIGFIAFEVWILIRVFCNQPIMLANGGGIGMTQGLELIINCHYNTTGLWGYCFLFLCMYLVITARKWLKPIYALGILVNLFLISMSKSRTSLYSTCLALGLFAAIIFWYQKCMCPRNTMTKIVISVMIGAATTAGIYYLSKLLYATYLKISDIERLLGVEAMERVFFDETMSLRTELWNACFKVMTSDVRTFLFGVSPIGIYPRMDALANQYVYTHNQILEFGVGCGVPSMILFIVFCFRKFLYSVRVCFISGNRSLRNAMPSVGCFLLLVGNMMEATLFGFNYLSGMIFIVLCGYMTEKDRNTLLKKKCKSESLI